MLEKTKKALEWLLAKNAMMAVEHGLVCVADAYVDAGQVAVICTAEINRSLTLLATSLLSTTYINTDAFRLVSPSGAIRIAQCIKFHHFRWGSLPIGT